MIEEGDRCVFDRTEFLLGTCQCPECRHHTLVYRPPKIVCFKCKYEMASLLISQPYVKFPTAE